MSDGWVGLEEALAGEIRAALGLARMSSRLPEAAVQAGGRFRDALLEQAQKVHVTLERDAPRRLITEHSIGQIRRFVEVLDGARGELTYTRRGLRPRVEPAKVLIDAVA